MTVDEIDALRAELDAQRTDIRAHLASEGVDVSSWDDDSE